MNRLYASVLSLLLTAPILTYANGDKLRDSVIENANGGTTAKPQWKKTDDLISGKIARIQLTKMKATVETLHSFLQDDLGGAGVWHGEYTAGNESYGIRCDFGKAELSISVNDLSKAVGHFTINRQDIMTIPAVSTIHNGCVSFEPGTLLVTARPDVLPYMPITRKEYLLMVENELNTGKARIVASVKDRTPVRSAEEQAAEKKRDLEEIAARYAGSEVQMRTKMYNDQYKSDEDYLKENIDKATADVDTTLHFIDGMLNRLAPATLNAPAVISPEAREFEGFRDGEPGMVMLIRPNPSFFEPGAPQEKPQFFVITWNADANGLGKTINPQPLQALLNK